MFHVLNGDATARVFLQAGLPGDVLVWREMLSEGPASNVVEAAALTQLRARWLEETLGVSPGLYLQGLVEQDASLRACVDHDEVVLWFEPDLFCQVNLLYLFDWFSRQQRCAAKLALIYPRAGEDGAPRSLGTMDGRSLAALFAARRPVSAEDLASGRRAWDAYCSPDPTVILALLKASDEPLSVETLRCHLHRYPSLEAGVDEIERQTLVALSDGVEELPSLFDRVRSDPRVARYGMGDLQFWACLDRLRRGAHPLVRIDGPPRLPRHGEDPSPELMVRWRVALTEDGRAVLDERADWVAMNGIDRWLGGVSLRGRDRIWRWSESAGTLVRR